jgi:hypothetical protein
MGIVIGSGLGVVTSFFGKEFPKTKTEDTPPMGWAQNQGFA